MFNIFRRQVGAKIILGYLASVSLMVIIGVLVAVRLTQVTGIVNDLTNNQAAELDLSNAIANQIVLVRFYANRYIQYQNQQDLDAFHASFSQLQVLLARAEQKTTAPDRTAALQTLRQALPAYGAAFDEITSLLRQRARIRSEVIETQDTNLGLELAALRVSPASGSDPALYLVLGNVQTDYQNMRLNTLKYILTGENRFVALFDLNYQDAQEHLADLNKTLTTPAQRQASADIEAAFAAYAQGFNSIQTGYARLQELEQTQLYRLGPEMSQAAFDIAAQVKQEFQVKNAEMQSFVVQTQTVLLAAILSAIAIGLVIGGAIARRITTPLRQVAQTAQQVANVDIKAISSELVSLAQGRLGLLDVNLIASPLEITSPDEVGQTGQAFNQIIVSLDVAGQSFRAMTAYLNEMASAARSVAQGNLDVNVVVRSPEDVLGNALAHMVANLRAAEAELRHYQEHLEELVRARTAELTVINQRLLHEATERERAEEELRAREHELRMITDNIPVFIGYVDHELRYRFVNKRYVESFGLNAEEIVGKHVREVLGEAYYSRAASYMEAALTGQEISFESPLDLPRLGTRWLSVNYVPEVAEPGAGRGVYILVLDITERKLVEEALKQAKAWAEERSHAAEAANRAKSTFLANMSHELRTPLNAILGFAQLMARDSQLTLDQRKNLETIGRSGEHLLALINEVLELSKIEAGRVELQLENFDLPHMLLGLEEMFRLRAETRGLSLVFEYVSEVPQHVRADKNKLRQVLINLLGNAVKFTEEGGIILRIDVRPTAEQESEGVEGQFFPTPLLSSPSASLLHFEIEDTGIGIAPAELDTIFDAFVQTDRGQSEPGTGLGLAIGREFVRVMGGDLTVSSEAGQGTVFRFDVQVEIIDAAEAQATQPTRRVVGLKPGQRAADGRPYRLLIVENEDANRQLLVKLLQPFADPTGNQGFEVREACNGQEAIEIWKTWQPHLIWMDMRMPVMDGHEATRRIKATSLGQKTIIVALTASAFEEDRAVMLAEGCDDFVRKPFQEADIFDKLTKHLGVRFVYEETNRPASAVDKEFESPRVSAQNLKAAIHTLPAGLLTELADAAKRIDMDTIDRLIDKIRAHNAAVANKLAMLAANFRYEEISALIQKAKEHKNE